MRFTFTSQAGIALKKRKRGKQVEGCSVEEISVSSTRTCGGMPSYKEESEPERHFDSLDQARDVPFQSSADSCNNSPVMATVYHFPKLMYTSTHVYLNIWIVTVLYGIGKIRIIILVSRKGHVVSIIEAISLKTWQVVPASCPYMLCLNTAIMWMYLISHSCIMVAL